MNRPTLHLGVVVQPYRTKSRKVKAVTTGDVAGYLEEKYGVIAIFYRTRGTDIVKALENSMGGALESLLMGQRIDPYAKAMSAIQNSFKQFISSKEVERCGIAGVPTQAALLGVNHRLAHPYAKSNPRRPSFVDTGLYLSSFRAWMD
jgi:hypothetical protein